MTNIQLQSAVEFELAYVTKGNFKLYRQGVEAHLSAAVKLKLVSPEVADAYRKTSRYKSLLQTHERRTGRYSA